MANLLDVSVSQLLGIEESIHSNGNLAEELAELNEQLARKKQKEKLLHHESPDAKSKRNCRWQTGKSGTCRYDAVISNSK